MHFRTHLKYVSYRIKNLLQTKSFYLDTGFRLTYEKLTSYRIMNFWFILRLQLSDFEHICFTFSGYNDILAPYPKLGCFIPHPLRRTCYTF